MMKSMNNLYEHFKRFWLHQLQFTIRKTKNSSHRSTQGSNLDSLFFNIFLNYNFLFISKFQLYKYADDSTLCKSRKNMY